MDESELTPLISRIHLNRYPFRKTYVACAAILTTTLSERISFYSLFGNLLYYLTSSPLCWAPSDANALLLVAVGVVQSSGLLFGWMSDSYLGRFNTIALGYVIYVLGYAYLPVLGFYAPPSNNTFNITYEGAQCNDFIEPTNPLKAFDSSTKFSYSITAFIVLTAVGAGIVRTNLAPFGGDQVRDDGTKATVKFFSWFYWAVNIGSLVAYAGVTFLQQHGGFFIGYVVPCLSLLLSLVVFLSCSSIYHKRKSESRMFKTIYKIYRNAFTVRSRWKQNTEQRPPRFVDYAKYSYGGEFDPKQVDEISDLWRVCIVYTLFLPYWICYNQLDGSWFLEQGLHLRLDKSDSNTCPRDNRSNVAAVCSENIISNQTEAHETKIPPAFLQLFNTLSVVLLLPLIQRLYTFLACHGVVVQTWKRIFIGMILLSLSMTAGGVLEFFRLNDMKECGFFRQMIGHTAYEASYRTSIWYQIPQYVLSGASEVFTIVAGIEYSYMMSPPAFQGVIMGLFWTFNGIGNFLAVGIPYIFNYIAKSDGSWYQQIWINRMFINCNRLDYYFFLLAGFLGFFSVVFLLVARFCDLRLNKPVVPFVTREVKGQLNSYNSSDTQAVNHTT